MSDINAVLAERGARYGKFTDHAEVTQTLKCIFVAKMGAKWDYLADDQKEALEMIAHKLGRIITGDANYADSWVDIAGYAKLVADRLDAPMPAPAVIAPARDPLASRPMFFGKPQEPNAVAHLTPAQVAQMEEACAASQMLELTVRGEVS